MGNTIGKNFRVTSFGESHGQAMGVVVDGMPAGVKLLQEDIQKDLNRRRPGASAFSSPRKEPDTAIILSGITSDGLTNGAPIAIVIHNVDKKSSDYQEIQNKFRPGHADWTYFLKYGLKPQPGGGRASGRETVSRVAAGAVARALLAPIGLSVRSGTERIGKISANIVDYEYSENDPLRFLDPQFSPLAQKEVQDAMEAGDSVGGVVRLICTGVPTGLGEPVFGKLEALLGGAFFSIGAVRAVELGEGIELSTMRGSVANDPIGPDGPTGNLHNGILGGISTGRPISARLFVRPTPSIAISQKTVDLSLEKTVIETHGRHDPCIAPRLAPVAEAMALIVLADCFLEGVHISSRLSFTL
ncbi:MAG: chorismate synthase [Deltaproteobacteria bacterium]|jgi:chorismate synthase|nr:chorismate synthase [Deltaproteobacteria bacterium]